MSVDINEKVLVAFQIEHKEQIEAIRSLLVELESDGTRDRPESIDEAFRLAHSLKGGARVCDLRPPEKLAHRLEYVFEQVRCGSLCLDADVIKTINIVLDAIEDWMAAIDHDEQPSDLHEALMAINSLIDGNPQQDATAKVVDTDVSRRLVSSFRGECPSYLTGLRQFVAALNDEISEVVSDDVEEAHRLAHNLRGSAHAASVTSIDEAAESLESLLDRFRQQSIVPDMAASSQLTQYLDTIEGELGSLLDSSNTALTADLLTTSIAAEGRPSVYARPTANLRTGDTVRISADSLDRLLRSSRQLVGEGMRQERMSRELEELRWKVDEMERERESIRRIGSTTLHRMNSMPEFSRLASYFETVDRGIQSLVRRTQQLCTVQKRNSWLLQSRGRQVQQDIRQARMVPAETVYQGLRKLVRDLAKEEGKQVEFRLSGFDVRADRMVFQALKDPLVHMLRNCIVHGIESPAQRAEAGKSVVGRVDLCIETVGNRLTIQVGDDGRGIDRDLVARRALAKGLICQGDLSEYSSEQIESLVFRPGFSTSEQVTELAGRGIGLSVVWDAVTRLQGVVQVCQNGRSGAKFRISVPSCVSTHRVLLVSAGSQTYAIPVHGIERLLRLNSSDLETIEGQPIVTFQNRPVPLVGLTSILGLESAVLKVNSNAVHVAIIKSSGGRVAVSVEAFVAERDLLIQDLEAPAASKAYMGAILLDDDNVALVLNPAELLARARPASGKIVVENPDPRIEKRTPRVLIVDDSFTTRTLEKSILEANGYEVGIAVDGVEALNQLKSGSYDLVISDVEMPRMDGFALLAEIKKNPRLASIPVIIVTSRALPEDRVKGLDLGADAYIVKQKFDHHSLLSAIRQLVDSDM